MTPSPVRAVPGRALPNLVDHQDHVVGLDIDRGQLVNDRFHRGLLLGGAVTLAGDQLHENDVVALLTGKVGGVEQLSLVVQPEGWKKSSAGMANPVTMPRRISALMSDIFGARARCMSIRA
jgi:hypothetical protein